MRLQFDPEVDYYEVLQVHPRAHPEIIKRAYRTLVAQLHAHPDLGGSHQQMVLINRAYEVLSSEELRAEYDRWRQAQSSQPTGTASPGPTPSSRPAPPAASASAASASAAGVISLACPNCGRRNRLPQDIGLFRARCGACGERLIPVAAPGAPRGPRADTAPHAERPAARRLPQDLYNDLLRDGELRVQLERVARGSRVACRKCQRPWWASRSGKPPPTCPSCGSPEWVTFRLFKCSQCGHEFETNSLRAWPYLLFPKCPGCGAPNWSRSAERNPLRWIISLLSRGKRR
jgi:curved DNA-binding protein CbpA